MLFRTLFLFIAIGFLSACQVNQEPGASRFFGVNEGSSFAPLLADSDTGVTRSRDKEQARERKTFGKTPYVYGSGYGQAILYPWNRFLDIFDIFRLNVGIGPAIGGNIRITRWASFGLEAGNSRHFGLPGSHREGWFLQRKWFWKERSPWNRTVGLTNFGTPFVPEKKDWEVGATLHGFVATIDVAIDFLALGDFILGIFCLDPEFDDDQWELPAIEKSE